MPPLTRKAHTTGGDDQLGEGEEEAAWDVDALLELAQDRGELEGVDVVGGQVVLDLLVFDGCWNPPSSTLPRHCNTFGVLCCDEI
ncbi:hypothetical protein ACFQ8C_36900 [Streptomyces sp. NPDC056503]|uniref:hypothetical protein n=1 Tax=Streptomyces sp. NPDC056503 TaxID=3345842 RepID=UPI00367F4065